MANQSEIARIREQLDAECEAARNGMYGYAETSKHEFITARMENMSKLHDELRELVGEEADKILIEGMNG